ncbi:MAG: hypothetical protein V7L29_11800 [Nostoc sp.]|uniref:hypothetical protein n=1 Tax=Nostoc sp. TaxID=1180 RepID=UPI002FF38F3D
MQKSIFQHLVDSVNKDYEDTYAYVGKNFDFIRELIDKIALHIQCTPGKDIYIVDEKGSKIAPSNFIQDAIIVDNECFFSFKLVISASNTGFNINSCGKSFFDKNLVPPSGIAIYISIKQEDDIFIVIAPSIKEEKLFTEIFKIYSDNPSWTELLESLTQVIINFSKKDLKYRISQLFEESSQQVKPFGFYVTPDIKIVNT